MQLSGSIGLGLTGQDLAGSLGFPSPTVGTVTQKANVAPSHWLNPHWPPTARTGYWEPATAQIFSFLLFNSSFPP